MLEMRFFFPSTHNSVEFELKKVDSISDFASGFSPLADDQVINLEWQGMEQKLVLCGENLSVWELAEPEKNKTDIVDIGKGCYMAAPLLPQQAKQNYMF